MLLLKDGRFVYIIVDGTLDGKYIALLVEKAVGRTCCDSFYILFKFQHQTPKINRRQTDPYIYIVGRVLERFSQPSSNHV